jgi:hypothetical protein
MDKRGYVVTKTRLGCHPRPSGVTTGGSPANHRSRDVARTLVMGSLLDEILDEADDLLELVALPGALVGRSMTLGVHV